MSKIRVLIVDDSVVIRQILSDLLKDDAELEVVGTAANGRIALTKIPRLLPDVITLDIEMPEMDGLATLREIRKFSPALPVIMFSTLSERGAAATIDALSAGASDYVTKPANVGSVNAAMARIKAELIPKIKSLALRAKSVAVTKPAPVAAVVPPPTIRPSSGSVSASAVAQKIRVVAIGVSTGGPNALADLLPALPANLGVPVLIVQHMPPMFTKFLADRLAAKCAMAVHEAKAWQKVLPGNIYLAPGDHHMVVDRSGEDVVIRLNQDAQENSCRPAVDVLFRSVAKLYGPDVLSVVLTGMGNDGTRGVEAIRASGGRCIVQDELTSVVWGMPGFVANAGLAEKVLPLAKIAPEIIRLVDRAGNVRLSA